MLDQWKTALSDGMFFAFSPSGHALAFLSIREPIMQVIEICFADGREPLVLEDESPITPLAWASDDELVYRVSGQPLGKADAAWIWVVSVGSGISRPLMTANDMTSIVWAGESGHLSVLAEPKGKAGLFDLDVNTGTLRRLSVFDSALERLEVYPLFGHSFFRPRGELALIAWPLGGYLPEGVEPTEANSHWSPILDEPSIQDYVDVRPDGTTITQREMTRGAKRMTPFRLFLLDATGGCEEVPETHKAYRPLWSPDGATLSFERFEHSNPLYETGSVAGVWLARRGDLSLKRVGGCGPTDSTIMHPSSVLLCRLEDETIPANLDNGRARLRSNRWRSFVLSDGNARADSGEIPGDF